MRVLLFDIDGTLIRTGGAGGAALMEAFTHEFRVDQPSDVPFAGRTDRGIAKNLFTLHGVDDTWSNWQRLHEKYLEFLTVHLPRHEGCVLPGIAPLLDAIDERSELIAGLLTGNTGEGARMKLEYYDLYHHFAFGGYGDQHPNRDDVAREALAASRSHLVDRLDATDVWVIGDTPLDIACARSIGANVAAVATGWHSVEKLAESKPDLLLADLQDASAFIQHLA